MADVRPNALVHVVLSPEAATALAPSIGANATAIDGKVLTVGNGTIRVAATQIARAIGPEEFLRGEPIDVPASGALSITVRSFDGPRTLLAVGGIVAGVIGAHAVAPQSGVTTVKGGPPSGTK